MEIHSSSVSSKSNPVSFGYKSPIKNIAKRCAYYGTLFTNKNKATFEHIKCHSVGGKTNLANCLACTSEANGHRGNTRFDLWLKQNSWIIENIQNYLDELRGIKVEGKDYVKEVTKTLNQEARGVVTFRGKLDYVA